MVEVESFQEIANRFRAEGKRTRDVEAEWKRQCREALRERESEILQAAELPGASEHTREVAESIRDHRAAGNYTTQG